MIKDVSDYKDYFPNKCKRKINPAFNKLKKCHKHALFNNIAVIARRQ
jgi:hypothetical protein